MEIMTDLDKARNELETVLDKIPVSGSFESAKLAKKPSELEAVSSAPASLSSN
jgi:hypothetical protein